MVEQLKPSLLPTLLSGNTRWLIVIPIAIAVVWILGHIFKRPTLNKAQRQSKQLHLNNKKQASRILDKVAVVPRPVALKMLRNAHPLVVEEVVILGFQRKGIKVKHSPRYTGDGGADGQVKLDGKWALVQTKRYGKSISPGHIQDFADLCHSRKCKGCFVHTGRTGPKSKRVLAENTHIRLLSGNNLISLLRPPSNPKNAERSR